MYQLVDNGFKLFNDFKPSQNENENVEIINILFINNNDFNLLLPKDFTLSENQHLIEKKVDLIMENIILENKITFKLIQY